MKIINFFKYLINLPIYILSLFIVRDKNTYIFGAWFGKKYADNSKYLFEYVSKNCPEITAVWLTTNKEVYNLVKSKNLKVCMSYSFLGYWYSLIAKYYFISTCFNDVNFLASGNAKVINLWHGIPLKKIMEDDKINSITKKKSLYIKIRNFIFPFLKDNYYSTISTSETVNNIYKSAFRNLSERFDILGQPRCDFISENNANDCPPPYREKLRISKNKIKKLLYICPPTEKKGKLIFQNS